MLYHNAIGTLPHVPTLAEFPIPTPTAGPGQVLIKTALVGMTPLSVWQLDYRFLAPKDKTMLLAGNVAGEVSARGEGANEALQVGTKVVVCNPAMDVQHLASQEIVLAEDKFVMPLPDSLSLEQGATLGASAVTAFHVLRTELGLHIPLELGKGDQSSATVAAAQEADIPVLIWGGSTSTAFYAIQILKAAGFKTIMTTSSPGSHARLTALGATHTLSYSDPSNTADRVLSLLSGTTYQHMPFTIDCVGDVATLGPISKVVGPGSKVAILTPVRRGKTGSETQSLVADDEIPKLVPWKEGVQLIPVKAFSYADRDPEMGANLQLKVLPAWVAKGALQTQTFKIVEGETFLERTAEALSLLREGRVRGEKLLVTV